MTFGYTHEELLAASYASLRAHATSEQAEALVTKLASMVEERTIQIGLRKKKRKDTVGRLEYTHAALWAHRSPAQTQRLLIINRVRRDYVG